MDDPGLDGQSGHKGLKGYNPLVLYVLLMEERGGRDKAKQQFIYQRDKPDTAVPAG
jgi:hypothetical protein